MTTYDLPEDTNIEGVGAVTLPFHAPIVYWRNGNQALQSMNQIQGVQRFGGWAIQTDQIDPFKETLQPLPASFELTELSGDEGSYKNYLSRSVFVAVIARRFAWFENKSVTQYLAYMDGFGAVILQSRSLGGVDLDSAVSNFKKLSATARWDEQRKKIVSEQFFYVELGTFGDTPVFEFNKSKNGQSKSAVNRVKVNIPQGGFTIKTTQFVGRDVAEEIVKIRRQAQEWLDDWNNRRQDKQNTLPPMPENVGFSDPTDENPFT